MDASGRAKRILQSRDGFFKGDAPDVMPVGGDGREMFEFRHHQILAVDAEQAETLRQRTAVCIQPGLGIVLQMMIRGE